MSQVAGTEPAIGEHVGGGIGVIIVAHHDVVAAHQHFAAASVVGLVNLDLHAGERPAHSLICRTAAIEGSVDGDDGRTLGDAVAQHQVNAHGAELLDIAGIQGGAAADDIFQVAAELLQNGGEEFFSAIQPQFEHGTAGSERQAEGTGLTLLLGGAPDGVGEGLHKQGHQEQDTGLDNGQLSHKGGQAVADDNGMTIVEHHQHSGAQPKDMGEGQDG